MTMKICTQIANCVSSQNINDRRYVEPISYSVSRDSAKKTIISILEVLNTPYTVRSDGYYIHATFTSIIFRFTDDVEFFIDNRTRKIHLKSASRVGFYDWGTNRRRIEKIRRLFSEAQN